MQQRPQRLSQRDAIASTLLFLGEVMQPTTNSGTEQHGSHQQDATRNRMAISPAHLLQLPGRRTASMLLVAVQIWRTGIGTWMGVTGSLKEAGRVPTAISAAARRLCLGAVIDLTSLASLLTERSGRNTRTEPNELAEKTELG